MVRTTISFNRGVLLSAEGSAKVGQISITAATKGWWLAFGQSEPLLASHAASQALSYGLGHEPAGEKTHAPDHVPLGILH